VRAAIMVEPGHIEMGIVAPPAPGPMQVLVQVKGCGVCASNLPLWEGRAWFQYPLAPGQGGHEGWGRIVKIGSAVAEWRAGDRVAFLSNHAYAEYDVADADSLVPLPPELEGQPFPGEPLGCAINVFRRSDLQAGQRVAIIGIGFLGALLTRLASSAGARVIAISRRSFALETARRFGAADTVRLDEPRDVVQQVMHLTEGEGCARVIEAVGRQEALDLATALTATRARLVIAGYHQDGLRQVDMQTWNWRGLDVINAHERDPRVYQAGMRAAIDAVRNGQLDPRPLYTEFPLERLGDAFRAMQTRPEGFVKALVIPGLNT
jgi:threonine dehydrogenase-like Zn-dependent dehydrogenase